MIANVLFSLRKRGYINVSLTNVWPTLKGNGVRELTMLVIVVRTKDMLGEVVEG